MKTDNICIVKCGSHTPVGTSAKMSAKIIKAGIVRFLSHPRCTNGDGKPIIMGLASYLDESLMGTERMTALLRACLDEIFQDMDKSKIPVIIGAPEKRPGFTEKESAQLQKSFKELNPDLILKGHASSIVAIEQACRLLASDAEFCIAGGVESYCCRSTLAWLDINERLKTSQNSFGFVPGEAAGALLITTTSKARQYNLPILAEITAIATADEEHTMDKDTVCTGKALSKAMHDVLKHLPSGTKADQIFCDLNGERYRTDEYGFAYLKNKQYFDKPDCLTAPSGHWGDIGAASSPNLINLAIRSGAKDSYKLIWSSSDTGTRGAVLIKTTGG